MSGKMGARDMTKWETAISKIVSGEDEEEVIIRHIKQDQLEYIPERAEASGGR